MTLKNKKIVFLLTNDFTFDSRVLKEANSAKKAGMKVTVLGRKSKNTSFKQEIDGIKIIRVQSIIDKIWAKISKTGGNEAGGSQSTGQPKLFIDLISPINLWLINRLFVQEAVRIKPHLVQANDSDTLLAGYALKKKGSKLVYDAHELYLESIRLKPFWVRWFFGSLEKKLGRNIDGVFSVCQPILDTLNHKYGLINLPQNILYNTPPYQKSDFVPPGRRIKILYLGAYSQKRKMDYLYRAIKRIKNTQMTVMGPGWDESRAGNITILPPVAPEEVVNMAQSYDIGVFPYVADNLNQLYSMPNKLFEYMMAGLAIAASDLPEVKKVITEAENGVLFNPRSTKDITIKLNYLVKNKEILTKFKQNSLKFAKKYSWENQEKKQLKLYEEILEK